jgi:hypothetical protein
MIDLQRRRYVREPNAQPVVYFGLAIHPLYVKRQDDTLEYDMVVAVLARKGRYPRLYAKLDEPLPELVD